MYNCPPKFNPDNPSEREQWERNRYSILIGHEAMRKYPPLKPEQLNGRNQT